MQVISIPKELSPQQVADLLHISRHQVLKLIENGMLKATVHKTRRRILFEDMRAYQLQQAESTQRLIDEIAELSQESGNYH